MSIIHKDIPVDPLKPQKETYINYYNNDVPLVSPSGETLPYINLSFTFATKVVLCLFVINRPHLFSTCLLQVWQRKTHTHVWTTVRKIQRLLDFDVWQL